MTDYNYILFDLDGTITDPAIGITNSVMYALGKFGISVNDRAELYKFIGPPLWESFEKFYGFSKSDSDKAVVYYREYFKEKGMYENHLYDGFADLLGRLKKSGRNIILATSKAEIFAKQILEYFNIAGHFSFVAGSNWDGTRINKEEIIIHILNSCGIADKTTTIMIGDREHDIIGAKKTGIKSIGVLYGYGSEEELKNAGADYIAETISDIEKILFNN